MPQPVRPSRYSERYVYDARLGGGMWLSTGPAGGLVATVRRV